MAGAVPTIPLPSGDVEPLHVPQDNQRISPDQYGAGIGEGLVQFAQGAERINAQEDALRAQEAETAYAQEILKRVHGTADPQTGEFKPGYAALKGHQAIQASAPLARELAGRREEIASGLSNDRQRRIFLGRTTGELLNANRSITAHAEEQTAFLRREGLKTRLATATQTAAAAVLTPGGTVDLIGADRQIAGMREWLELAAEEQGLKGEDAERFVREGQGGVAEAVMERLLEDPTKGGRGHAAEAKAFLEANREIIPEKVAYRFKERLGAAVARDSAIEEADRIWATAEGDPAKAMEGARAADTGIRGEVERLVIQRVQQDRVVQQAADAPRAARLEQSIYQGRGLSRVSDDYKALSGPGKADIDEKYARFQSTLRTLGATTDDIAVKEFEALVANDLEAAAKVNVREVFKGRVSPRAMFILEAKQGKAKTEWDKDRGVKAEEFGRMVEFEAKGLPRSLVDGKEDLARLKAHLGRKRSDWLSEPGNEGKIPPREIVTEWIADALTVVDVRLGRDVPRYKAQRADLERPAAQGEGSQPYLERRGAKEAPATLPGTRRPGTELGYPGGVFEAQPNGKWKRVE